MAGLLRETRHTSHGIIPRPVLSHIVEESAVGDEHDALLGPLIEPGSQLGRPLLHAFPVGPPLASLFLAVSASQNLQGGTLRERERKREGRGYKY